MPAGLPAGIGFQAEPDTQAGRAGPGQSWQAYGSRPVVLRAICEQILGLEMDWIRSSASRPGVRGSFAGTSKPEAGFDDGRSGHRLRADERRDA
jgi:hypothetical protein